ncbi:MAG TPA: efflux RND transporter periplasmic adaptor subunit [Planctomycetota bacterium]
MRKNPAVRNNLLAAIAVPLLWPLACSRPVQGPAAEADPRVMVRLRPVKVQPLVRTIEVVGTLRGDEEAMIGAKVVGRIAAVEHDLGDVVAAGAVLARIEPADYELAVAQKQAALLAALAELGLQQLPEGEFDPDLVPAVARARIEAKNAAERFQRGELMFAEKPPLITEQEHADLKTAMLSAAAAHAAAVTASRATLALAAQRAAELAQSRQALADTEFRAPPGGPWRVGRRLVAPGDYMQEATVAFQLVDGDPIEFRADVPERWSRAVQKGQRVIVEVPSGGGPRTGIVARIAPVADARKRAFEVEISLPNGDGSLLPGGFARGLIETHTDPAVVFVPQDAVVTALGQSKVFTVKDGKAVEHEVTTGTHDGAFLEVVKGDLRAGDEVVVSGAARLAEGVPVQVAAAEAGK